MKKCSLVQWWGSEVLITDAVMGGEEVVISAVVGNEEVDIVPVVGVKKWSSVQ